MRKLGLCLLAATLISANIPAHAVQNKARLMFMTSSYGVMIGSLSGLATLAFYEHPSEKTRNVALGASLGLYTGIFLGVYMLYVRGDPNAPSSPSYQEEDASWRPPAATNDSLNARLNPATEDGAQPARAIVQASNRPEEASYIWVPTLGFNPTTRTPNLGLSLLF